MVNQTIIIVKEGRVFFFYSLFRTDLKCFVTPQCMAKWLYPDVHADLEPEENTKTFYDQFMLFEWKVFGPNSIKGRDGSYG